MIKIIISLKNYIVNKKSVINENTTFGELIKRSEWLSVQNIFTVLYPDDCHEVNNYKSVYFKLKELDPTPSAIILEMDRMWENGIETDMANVYAHDPTSKNKYTTGVAAEFLSWSKWLDFKIGLDARAEWSEIEIICHGLYEMTMEGFTQEEIQISLYEIIGNVSLIKDEYFKSK